MLAEVDYLILALDAHLTMTEVVSLILVVAFLTLVVSLRSFRDPILPMALLDYHLVGFLFHRFLSRELGRWPLAVVLVFLDPMFLTFTVLCSPVLLSHLVYLGLLFLSMVVVPCSVEEEHHVVEVGGLHLGADKGVLRLPNWMPNLMHMRLPVTRKRMSRETYQTLRQ
jgi:hypothetical protein